MKILNPLCYCDGMECSYCFDSRMAAQTTQTNTSTMTTTKLEEKRSSGFTIMHEFKTELHAIKYVSMQTDIVEKAVKEHLTTDGIFKHEFMNGIEVQYKLNP